MTLPTHGSLYFGHVKLHLELGKIKSLENQISLERMAVIWRNEEAAQRTEIKTKYVRTCSRTLYADALCEPRSGVWEILLLFVCF